jgi:hypothetical protein
MILTAQVHEFREAVRHLWNAYMRLDATWDTVDEFGKVSNLIFTECVVARAGVAGRPIAMDNGREVLTEYRVFADNNGRLPLLANRDLPASGYWDHPVGWIPPEQHHTIHPICFFDFDVRGWRSIQYYRVRIVASSSHPELNGRDALIDCRHAELELMAEQVAAPDAQKDARG